MVLLLLVNPSVQASHNITQELNQDRNSADIDSMYNAFHLNYNNTYRIDVSVTNDSGRPVNVTLYTGNSGWFDYMYNYSSAFDSPENEPYYKPSTVLNPGETTFFQVAYGCTDDVITNSAVVLELVSPSDTDQSTVVFNATDEGVNEREYDCPGDFTIAFPIPFSSITVIIGTLVLIRRYRNSS